MDQPLTRLTQGLRASFSNKHQAFESPPLYGNILVRLHPLTHWRPGSLLLEQADAISAADPYRVRAPRADIAPKRGLIIHNHSSKEAQRFWADMDHQQRRKPIQEDDLNRLEGCTYMIKETPTSCRIDRGHDRIMHEHLWGAITEPFRFEKTQDFFSETPKAWINKLNEAQTHMPTAPTLQ